MDYETIRLSIDPRGVAALTLARPKVHNAMNGTMWAELLDAARMIDADPGIRAVVLSGEGRSFCAGGDLRYQQAQGEGSAEERRQEAVKFSSLLRTLDTLGKPLIGRINGSAYAGGFSLISVCDVAIGAAGASFAITEARLGLIPAVMLPYVVRRVGVVTARRLFLTARTFSARDAASFGLLDRAVPAEDLDAAIEEELALILKCAPGALRVIKGLVAAAAQDGTLVPDALTVEKVVSMWDSAEGKEGILSYLEKRSPVWAV